MPTAVGLSSAETVALFKQHVIANYNRYPVNLVRGEGSLVWDSEGNRYLDFFPGWGCNLLGHCPPKVVAAVQEQVATLIHVPNTWHMDVQGRWAQVINERSFGGQAFFCNSGTEANEAAIKIARLHSPKGKYKIITFTGGFHGRTMGSVTATAQPKYHDGIEPMLPGFVYAPFGDLEATRELVDDETCAIMIEPIQGEGGVRIPPAGFLQGLRDLCNERGLLLMFDEVQTGCGRTGDWFAYQKFGVTPDVMTLAKAVCGGIAGGALIAKREIAPALRPGMHAATFGGNPIAARAGIATFETIEEENLLDNAKQLGELFRRRLTKLQQQCDLIKEVRVAGVMIGVELSVDGNPAVQACLERKLLINCTQGKTIRLLPAMNLPEEQAEEGCDILADVLQKLPRS
ncbi:Acetylornithine aminotransferase [Anatilimnocola aggregata]|uniref:Acetylornithine aminotransferase n=1 Tax=Anatilimnocola aggregata TaxID=2528021 RepID=A0A517YD68_9BACT|nr:aspartate aminotransferase family protein [Anatilimnocola aggregata]QDU28185.1 Acetylornithine aminotransferase [Anatilimnocola aggregata]